MDKQKDIRNIGIMRTSALGDIIWTLPMIRRLQAFYRNAKITIFVDKAFSSLLDGINDLEVITISKPKSLSDYVKLRKIFSEFEFDIFLCAQANLRINFLYPLINSKRKIGFDEKRGRDAHFLFIDERIPYRKEHSLDAFLGFTDYLKIESNEVRFDIPVSDEDRQWTQEKIGSEDYIVVHPKASSVQRTWSEQSYAKVIDELSKNYKVVLTGAPSDKEFNEKVLGHCESTALNIAGESSLKQLASVLEKASLVIAPDSGPIHLAQAMGAKTMGLFAAVPPEYTGPYRQEENCINVYPQAVEKFLKKSVDSVEWRTRVRHDDIMSLIDVEQVISKAKELLDQ